MCSCPPPITGIPRSKRRSAAQSPDDRSIWLLNLAPSGVASFIEIGGGDGRQAQLRCGRDRPRSERTHPCARRKHVRDNRPRAGARPGTDRPLLRVRLYGSRRLDAHCIRAQRGRLAEGPRAEVAPAKTGPEAERQATRTWTASASRRAAVAVACRLGGTCPPAR